MTDDMKRNKAFDHWLYSTIDDRVKIGKFPIPLLTTMLYRICQNDHARFEELLLVLEQAFEAGQRSKADK